MSNMTSAEMSIFGLYKAALSVEKSTHNYSTCYHSQHSTWGEPAIPFIHDGHRTLTRVPSRWFGDDSDQAQAYQQFQDTPPENSASLSHELIAGAASYEVSTCHVVHAS
jgi:hypothetical protein